VDAAATLVLNQPGALRALFLPPSDLTAGEAYIYDDVNIEGDIFSLLEWANSLSELRSKKITSIRVWRELRKLPADHRRSVAAPPRFRGRLHSRRRDQDVVGYHYNTGNDFYEQFLGETMVYSSAYFLDPSESLDVAQRRKLDVICRKLELSGGTRFLDIGCGWGSLVIHAATNYGVEATGVTLSEEQAEYANRRVNDLGLEDRVHIILSDYRELKDQYDAIASIGMIEHVGRKNLPEYFRQIRWLMAPGGLFLNHGITTRNRHPGRVRPTFVSTYVFPDGELEPIDLVVGEAQEAGFETRDLESLRMSYAETLKRWVANLEAHHDEVVRAAGEQTYRIWRAYMAGSSVSFSKADIDVYQTLLGDPDRPWRYGRRRLLAEDDN
jgi:cyclopropane-fatty-acyl-phospholipid synthase